ncbi:choice-of-anchor E domain-containing protein [Siccirubricoccus phaeus]|uniref:choice-of-anchor E domain-containing protein n=1 Tax=Siccirubricoccus phaeus TaxID=2595053 RepID=UPI00165C05A0|nr:choice-of-anchor E domain-containing protein [Siccirubricoccus phaeus]
MRNITLAAAVLGVALSIGSAKAAVLTYSDTVPTQLTNFDSAFSLPLFDAVANNGTLTSVKFTLSGVATGSISFENFAASSATITTQLSAVLTLSRPGGGATIVITTPIANNSDSVTSFDGTIDFGGTSGRTYSGINASDSDEATLTDGVDLALFTGTGSILLPISAVANSSATGSGNIINQFNTNAGATVTVEYTYTPNVVVPEPLGLSLLGAGLLGLGIVRARRKA